MGTHFANRYFSATAKMNTEGGGTTEGMKPPANLRAAGEVPTRLESRRQARFPASGIVPGHERLRKPRFHEISHESKDCPDDGRALMRIQWQTHCLGV